MHKNTVKAWRDRYQNGGLDALMRDAPRPGGKPSITPEHEQRIVEATLYTTPPNATHWSLRTMAKAQGVGRMTVQRVWRKYQLKPHLMETFKLSNDPKFLEKLEDVVGLYLNPPEHAIVLSVDEKSQIQALDRTQLMLPIGPGVPAKQTHDYKRNGTTTLFAALNVAEGTIISDCMERHTHAEFLKFLKKIDRNIAGELDLHVIVDNYGTHKHPKVRAWLAKHPRFHFHFIPTSSSWLNLVERWFGELTQKRIRRGTFKSVKALIDAIDDFIVHHNANPKPFIWSASVERILEKIAKVRHHAGT